jgi:histidinol phosphatase-like enzyme
MVIFVDIDKTICTDSNGKYDQAQPIPSLIEKINRLFDQGHLIVYWSSRGQITKIDWTDITKKQLLEWGVKYHTLRLDKPYYDLIIDDKLCRIEDLNCYM